MGVRDWYDRLKQTQHDSLSRFLDAPAFLGVASWQLRAANAEYKRYVQTHRVLSAPANDLHPPGIIRRQDANRALREKLKHHAAGSRMYSRHFLCGLRLMISNLAFNVQVARIARRNSGFQRRRSSSGGAAGPYQEPVRARQGQITIQ